MLEKYVENVNVDFLMNENVQFMKVLFYVHPNLRTLDMFNIFNSALSISRIEYYRCIIFKFL